MHPNQKFNVGLKGAIFVPVIFDYFLAFTLNIYEQTFSKKTLFAQLMTI